MKYYAQYYINDLAGKPRPLCGSDGVLPLDARYTQYNMIQIAKDHISNMLKGKYIVGISLQRGNYRSSKEVKYITIKAA